MEDFKRLCKFCKVQIYGAGTKPENLRERWHTVCPGCLPKTPFYRHYHVTPHLPEIKYCKGCNIAISGKGVRQQFARPRAANYCLACAEKKQFKLKNEVIDAWH